MVKMSFALPVSKSQGFGTVCLSPNLFITVSSVVIIRMINFVITINTDAFTASVLAYSCLPSKKLSFYQTGIK